MNIPQTPGPNEKLHHSTLSLSLSPRKSVRDTSNFCACFQSCLYASKQASKQTCYDMCVRKTCTTEEEEDMWIKLVPTSGKKKTNQKPK